MYIYAVGILTYNAMFILEYIMCRFHGKTRSIFLLRVSCGSHGQSGVARWLCPNAFPCAQYFTGNIEYCTTATVSMIKAEQTPLITTVLLAEKTLIFGRHSHLGSSRTSFVVLQMFVCLRPSHSLTQIG